MGKKKMKNRIITGSMILAFAAAVTVFLVMLQIEKNTLSQFEKERVYIAKTNLSKGQYIDEKNYLLYMEEAEIESRYIPEHAVKAMGNLGEILCEWDIEKGVILTDGMFETVDHITENMEEPVIAGLKADDIYQVSGGILRSGDKIHIFGANEDGSVTLKWSDIYIQQVFDNAGKAIAASDSVTVAQRINIYMDKKDVEKLYTDLGTGSLRVVKVCE